MDINKAIAYQEKIVNKIHISIKQAQNRTNTPKAELEGLKAKLEVNQYILDILRGKINE